MNKYVKKAALMIPYIKRYHEYHSEEVERLRQAGIKYHSCSYINNYSLQFVGRIDSGGKCMRCCCEPFVNFPGIAFCETPKETMESFAKLRAEIMAESIRFSLLGKYAADEDRKFTSGCAKCDKFRQNNWWGDGLIHHINLSMYPAHCQCKCIYCSVLQYCRPIKLNAESIESYEKVFAVIDYVQHEGMTARDLIWTVASGEITIHPLRDRLFSLIKDQTASFDTNCFIFDEKLAANLKVNKRSSICFSVDSGTPETWHKIKGVDNFDTVMENLARYLASGARPEQINLKYIVLPGINDNPEDYRSIIDIMKKRLKNRLMFISCDVKTKYLRDEEQSESLVRATGYLLAMLRRNSIAASFGDNFFLQDEIEKISLFADELLKSGDV